MGGIVERCKECGEYPSAGAIFTGRAHRCEPLWLVWNPHNGTMQDALDYGQYHRADSAETAAEVWAEWEDCNSAEYSIANGVAETVLVVAKGGAEADAVTFTVSGEYSAEYSAREGDQ